MTCEVQPPETAVLETALHVSGQLPPCPAMQSVNLRVLPVSQLHWTRRGA